MLPTTPEPFVAVAVECHAGYRGEETPRRFGVPGAQVEIAEVLDRWLAPDHRYFKVRDGDGDVYILRHDVASGRWEVTFYRRRTGGATSPPPPAD